MRGGGEGRSKKKNDSCCIRCWRLGMRRWGIMLGGIFRTCRKQSGHMGICRPEPESASISSSVEKTIPYSDGRQLSGGWMNKCHHKRPTGVQGMPVHCFVGHLFLRKGSEKWLNQ